MDAVMSIALSLDRHIVSTPDTLGGKPRIAGRRNAVADVAVWYERMGKSADELCAEHGLTLAEVYAALAYYYDHKREIDESLAAGEAWVDSMRATTASRLEERLKGLRGG
jgi:uncharacterized protein (DUF433 family)